MSKRHRLPNRRRFLQFGGAVLPASLIAASQSNAQQARIPTASDSEGPFFVANAPEVENLNRFGKTGEQMRIVGRVMNAGAPEKPVRRAKLEIWQTDGTGRYYPQANGNYRDFSDSEIDMRGTVYTDRTGRFDVMSLFPAEYTPRPSHIHYWVHADGFRSLVTQHYLDTRPRNRPHRTADVDRSQSPAVFPAPIIFLEPL
mgnify:CR=1 FL=1